MKYAIVNAEKAQEMGIDLALHRVSGGKVVLNENELLMLGKAHGKGNLAMAETMGGEGLLAQTKVRKITNQWEDR